MAPAETVAPVCQIDWAPIITAGQTVLVGIAALLSAYTIRVLRNGSARKPHGRRATDVPAETRPPQSP